MLAIAQSWNKFHYLNWIPSESGPLVTHFGNIIKEIEDPENIKQYYYEILAEILANVDNEESICTFSLDKNNLIISSSYVDTNNPDLRSWYELQRKDENLDKTMDYYHYPMSQDSSQLLSFAVPKNIRQSFQNNMRMLKARLNGISTGIFSAENGARYWFHADKLDSYLIWKIGNKKKDEFLFINNNQLASYFSITRSIKKNKINWNFGNKDVVDKVCQYIEQLVNSNQYQAPASKIFIYTCDDNIDDVKELQKKGKGNMILLNPLSVLKLTNKEKVNLYRTLPLAETGNAFGSVDV